MAPTYYSAEQQKALATDLAQPVTQPAVEGMQLYAERQVNT